MFQSLKLALIVKKNSKKKQVRKEFKKKFSLLNFAFLISSYFVSPSSPYSSSPIFPSLVSLLNFSNFIEFSSFSGVRSCVNILPKHFDFSVRQSGGNCCEPSIFRHRQISLPDMIDLCKLYFSSFPHFTAESHISSLHSPPPSHPAFPLVDFSFAITFNPTTVSGAFFSFPLPFGNLNLACLSYFLRIFVCANTSFEFSFPHSSLCSP